MRNFSENVHTHISKSIHFVEIQYCGPNWKICRLTINTPLTAPLFPPSSPLPLTPFPSPFPIPILYSPVHYSLTPAIPINVVCVIFSDNVHTCVSKSIRFVEIQSFMFKPSYLRIYRWPKLVSL
jgi:hypothetical protein